ncbi:lysophospholipase L1-like esterase [Duganella sp. 1411]|uniref:GDSL-type esterase/lipase family protein n=1 Tax=Duganella sp. 1411 TaxID=2806572 RepID=UPI001AE9C4F2|nr:GDSL-type esterase/lipase family protein [Duganella sp. 1411]MBP1207655.1 lysophospholipase L1-like esterase [Duganella sp. 1411]
MTITHRRAFAAIALACAAQAGAAPHDISVFNSRVLDPWQVAVADSESQKTLDGASAVIAPANKAPNGSVSVSRSGMKKADDALTLQWKDTWYASLRIDAAGQPADLRPYIAKGVLALDVNVKELSNGGIGFKVGCGEGCERAVPYVLPGRAAAGKGWRHLVFAMSCFVRDGADFSKVARPFALDGTGTGEVAVANVKILKAGKPNVGCPDYRTASVTPEKLNESWSISWWTPRHEKKLEEAKALGKKSQIVFIGDSITEGWEKSGAPVWERYYKPMDGLALGFGGDRTENVLWRLLHGEVDGLAPKVAVLMFGTNNTGHRQEDPNTTAAGIKRNIDELRRRLPDTKILLLAIFPRGEKPDDTLRRINDKVNAIIAGYADNRHVFFADINQQFLAADGTLSTDIMPDLLHPNEKGYEIWAKALAPELEKLMSAGASRGAGYAWQPVAIGGSGFVSGIITSKTEKDLIYLRTDVGGAYRWDAANKRWIALMDWVSDKETGMLGVESIAIDPNTPGRVYMSTGIEYMNGGASAILKSSDYGKTFTKIDVTNQFKVHGNGMGRGNGEKLQVDPVNGKILYIGTRANGMFKSVDEGLSWRRLDGLDVTTTPNNKNGVSFVVLDPSSASGGATQRLFAGVSRFGKVGPNMYMSSDAGKTFAAMDGGPAGLMPQRAVLADGKLVVAFAKGAGPWGDVAHGEGLEEGGVWQYDIGAKKWTDISPPLNRAYAGITVDPGNPKRMVVTTISYYRNHTNAIRDQFFETLDGGKSWKSIVDQGAKIDANGVSWIGGSFIHWAASVEFDPFDTRKLMVVSGNGIFNSTDINATPAVWKFEDEGLEESVPLNIISIPGGPVISAIGDYDGFRHTDVTKYSPIHTPSMGTTWGLDYAAQKPNVVARVGSAMYLSDDMGVSWKKTAALKGKQGQLALSADGKAIVHSPEKSTTSYVSTDGGGSWNPVKGLDGARPVADPVNPARFYALGGDRLLASTDGGASFAPAGALATAKGTRAVLRAAPGREGDLWVPRYDGGLARSTDGGATFRDVPGVSYAAAVGFGKAAPGAAYPAVYIWGTVGGVRGLFRSTDAGAGWLRINDDDHQYGGPGDAQFVIGDNNTFGNVFMSTAGRGIVFGKPTLLKGEK